jgi:hypothetical protein
VLEDVRDVRAALESLDESAGRAARAWMFAKRRERGEQSVGEAGDAGRRDGLECTETDVARDDWRQAPIVWSAECAQSRDAQFVWVDRDDGRRSSKTGFKHRTH